MSGHKFFNILCSDKKGLVDENLTVILFPCSCSDNNIRNVYFKSLIYSIKYSTNNTPVVGTDWIFNIQNETPKNRLLDLFDRIFEMFSKNIWKLWQHSWNTLTASWKSNWCRIWDVKCAASCNWVVSWILSENFKWNAFLFRKTVISLWELMARLNISTDTWGTPCALAYPNHHCQTTYRAAFPMHFFCSLDTKWIKCKKKNAWNLESSQIIGYLLGLTGLCTK